MFLISVMNLLAFFVGCLVCGAFANLDNFYPFGPSQGDNELADADDSSSPEIPISTRLVFFDGAYHSLWVCNCYEIHTFILTTRDPFIYLDVYHAMSCYSSQVNHNGIITTSGPFYTYTSAPFPLNTGNPGIAPYWTDVDISNPNNVPDHAIFYRQDTSEDILMRATAEVMASFADEVPTFQAAWTLVATWYRVTFYGNEGFQHPTPVSVQLHL